MTNRTGFADFVTGFATGWPEDKPDLMILSLTTQKGVQDFAISKDQALLIAKTMKKTAAQLAVPKPKG
jgi:predicted type IV restriction endonuclease